MVKTGIFSLVPRVIPPVTSQLTTVFLMHFVWFAKTEAVKSFVKTLGWVNLSQAPRLLWKFLGQKPQPMEFPHDGSKVFLDHPFRKFHFFFNWPPPLEILPMSSNFFWNSPIIAETWSTRHISFFSNLQGKTHYAIIYIASYHAYSYLAIASNLLHAMTMKEKLAVEFIQNMTESYIKRQWTISKHITILKSRIACTFTLKQKSS